MRHMIGQEFRRERYLEELAVSEASRTLKRRLEMLDIGNNLGRNRMCKCGMKESTEHMIECIIQKVERIEVEWLKET